MLSVHACGGGGGGKKDEQGKTIVLVSIVGWVGDDLIRREERWRKGKDEAVRGRWTEDRDERDETNSMKD